MSRPMKALVALLTLLACAIGVPTATAAPTSGHTATSRPAARPNDNWWLCTPGNPGYQCDQTDPFDTGCAKTKIYVASGTAYLGSTKWQVQLYYSTACGTMWSRLQLLSGSNSCFNCLLEVIRSNFDASSYTTSDVGSSGGTLYSGAWSNQLYYPCGGVLKGTSELWHFIYGDLGTSNSWFPGC